MNLNISTEERLLELQKLRESGEYSIASIDMFDDVKNLEMTDKLYSHINYIEEMFKEYLEKLLELNDQKPGLLEYLKTIRYADVIDNQKMESQNSFLIGLYYQLSRETMMGRLIKYEKAAKELTGRDLFSLHSTLLNGTLSEGMGSVRTDNSTFVGGRVNGVMEIDYFTIDYKDIKLASEKLVDIYNNKLDGELYDNMFIQPFLLHGLFAALQIFKDGNTRTGRVMQHALLWKLLRKYTDYKFDSPPIFATRSYFPYRCDYRNKINNLVRVGNNSSWEDWFIFNLNRVQDAIWASEMNLEELKRIDPSKTRKRTK